MADEFAPIPGSGEAVLATSPMPAAPEVTGPEMTPTPAQEPRAPVAGAPVVEVEGDAGPAPAPEPQRLRFADLYRADPDFKRQADGHFGQRLQQERAAEREAVQRELASQSEAQQQAAIESEWDREAERRAQELARYEQMAESGDPNVELEDYVKRTKARRTQWQQRWDRAMATRTQAQEKQQVAIQGISQERAAWHGAMDEIFRGLPPEVQSQLLGRNYQGTPQQILVQQMQDYLGVIASSWGANLDQRVEAEVQKRMGKAHLAEPATYVTAGTNGTGGGQRFAFLEDAEKALREKRITVADLKRVKAAGVKYKRDW